MKIVYSPAYEVDLGPHVFPTTKYRFTKESLLKEKCFNENDFVLPQRASEEELALCHSEEYINKVRNVSLSLHEIQKLEIPLTGEISNASFLCAGGTILACRHALDKGVGLHNGGGFHHAFEAHGEGFCVFNDIAVAIKVLMKDGLIKRPMVIDCDLHQGNGTASIFHNNKDVFTFSIHQEDIYPFIMPKSSLDIPLKNGPGDDEYLSLLSLHIPLIIGKHAPELVVYQAGADPYADDQLGSLKISIKGLEERDRLIKQEVRKHGIPIVITLGGGYARKLEDTVKIHSNTFKIFTSKNQTTD